MNESECSACLSRIKTLWAAHFMRLSLLPVFAQSAGLEWGLKDICQVEALLICTAGPWHVPDRVLRDIFRCRHQPRTISQWETSQPLRGEKQQSRTLASAQTRSWKSPAGRNRLLMDWPHSANLLAPILEVCSHLWSHLLLVFMWTSGLVFSVVLLYFSWWGCKDLVSASP